MTKVEELKERLEKAKAIESVIKAIDSKRVYECYDVEYDEEWNETSRTLKDGEDWCSGVTYEMFDKIYNIAIQALEKELNKL